MGTLYVNSPIFFQNLYWSLWGLNYKLIKEGRLFKKLLAGLEKSQYVNDKIQREEQDRKLSILITHCYNNVPYYQNLFHKIKLKPKDISSQKDILKLPLTTKEDVRIHRDQFLSRTANKWLVKKAQTSGTTGKPLVLFRDRYSTVFENAMIWRQYRWAGVNPGSRIATLRGYLVKEIADMNAPFWRNNYAQKRLLMSSYHISNDTALNYLSELKKFKPSAIEAYPSSIYSLVKHLKFINATPIKLKAVFTSSENLYSYQRKTIEDYFDCKVYDLYGNAERTNAIGTCEYGSYHVFNDYSVTEFVKAENQDSKSLFEIVGTNLNNFAMPLLRYQTGDLADLQDSDKPCNCGRALPVIKRVESFRVDEHLTTPDGRRLQSVEQMAEGLNNVQEYQVVQEKIDLILIKVVTTEHYNNDDERLILKKAQDRLGKSMRITVEPVEMIERTKGGKFRFIINKLEDSERL